MDRILALPFWIWIVVAGAWGYLTYNSQQTERYDPLVAQVINKQEMVNQLKAEVNKAEAFKKERNDKYAKLQQLIKTLEASADQLPRTTSLPELLKSISQISERSGLELLELKPQPQRPNQFLVETPLQIVFRGTYVQMMSFLDSMAHLKRIVHVDAMKIEEPRQRGDYMILKTTASLVTFHFEASSSSLTSPSATPNQPLTGAATPSGAVPPGSSSQSGAPSQ